METNQDSRRTVLNKEQWASKIIKLIKKLVTTSRQKRFVTTLFPQREQKMYHFVVVCQDHILTLTISAPQPGDILLKESLSKEFLSKIDCEMIK